MQLTSSSGFLKFIVAWTTSFTCVHVLNVHSPYTQYYTPSYTHISIYTVNKICSVSVGSDGVYVCCRKVKNSYPRSLKNGIIPVSATYIVSFKLDKITRSNTCQNICERHISIEGFGIDKYI